MRRTHTNEIPAGSMADIAFLLLIFFLCSTQIFEDQGISTNLPAMKDKPLSGEGICLGVLLNANGELLVDRQQSNLTALEEQLGNYLKEGDKACVSLTAHRSAKYADYLQLYDIIMKSWKEEWDRLARKNYAKPYSLLSTLEKNSIKEALPILISESDPVQYN